jgi:hypothetical protein
MGKKNSKNNIDKILQNVNTLISAIKNKGYSPDIASGYLITRIKSEDNNTRSLYETIIDSIWSLNSEVKDTITRKTVEKIIERPATNLFIHSFKGKSASKQTINDIIETLLKSSPLVEWEVFAPIYGVEFKNATAATPPLILGPYNIYNAAIHKSLFNFGEPYAENFISIKINSREGIRAIECSKRPFIQFESVIRYMLGSQDNFHDVGVFDYYVGFEHFDAVSNQGSSFSDRRKGAMSLVQIDSLFFTDEKNGNLWIWNILKRQNEGKKLSRLQERILSAIEWVGKGIRDVDPARSLVQYIFAIESLLTFFEKGVLVNPSIAYRIAELCAFIIGTDLKSRLTVVKLVNDLYSCRSKVAHGGSNNISKEDLTYSLCLAKELITRMITDPEISKIKTPEKLIEWAKEKKYSSNNK